jgi:hypothetical protein
MALYQVPTENSLQYTLDANYTSGGSVLTLSATLTGVVQAPGVCVVDRIDSAGSETPTKRDYFTFTGVSGTTLTGCSGGKAGSTNQNHTVGAIIEFTPDITWAQAIYDAITEEHSTAGVHDDTKVVTPTGTTTLTNKTLTTPIIASFYQDAGKTKLMTTPNTASDTLAAIAATQTLTNKRITKRVVTTTDDATAVIDCDITDDYQLSAVANNTEFTITGTPTDGQQIIIRYKDAGVSKSLTWTGITALGITLPTATTASKWGYVGIKYNAAATAWHAIATTTEA